jgi:RNA polymerase sigma factor (sigma-70 family)
VRRVVAGLIALPGRRGATGRGTSEARTDRLLARLAECRDPGEAQEIRRDLVLANRERAERIARRYRERGVDEKRLRAVALDAMANAIRRYDPAQATDFRSDTAAAVRGAVRRQLDRQEQAWWGPGGLDAPPTLEGIPLDREQTRAVLVRVVPCLAPRDRDVLELSFFDGLSQHDVAARLGLRPAQVARATRRIRKQLRIALHDPAGP